jgi:uncharacterized protein
LALWTTAAQAFEVPYLSGRIVDQAQLLDEAREEALTMRLERLERETGAQLVVLTLPSLDGLSVEDASIQVVETWKLGRADADDGVLLLVAPTERKLRIEVGYGLEGAIPDARARRIVDHAIVPLFKSGDFPAGIEAGISEIEKAVRGEADSLPQSAGGDSSDPRGDGCFVLFFLAFMVPFVWAAIATRGGSGWFLMLFLTPFFAGFSMPFIDHPGIVSGLWLVLATIARILLPKRWQVEPSKSSGRGSSFGGGGGWSGGGGGFSGGGGSFGGGGASGGW